MRVIITQLNVPPPIPAAVANGVAAAPGGQTGATVLAARWNIVTVGLAGNGVALQAIGGGRQGVCARTGYDLVVYPSAGTQIEGNGVNIPVVVANNGNSDFIWNGIAKWVSV